MARSFLTDIVIERQRELRLADADSSNYVGFKSPATVSANLVWTLPSADGSNGQSLTTNGFGVLSWAYADQVLGIACGDETTALTTGTAKVTFRMPYAATLLGVKAEVNTAPIGSTLIVDINEAGTSILSTKLSIDASEKSSDTAATAAVILDSSLANDAEITIDIDQIGSTNAGKGLKVWLYLRRTG